MNQTEKEQIDNALWLLFALLSYPDARDIVDKMRDEIRDTIRRKSDARGSAEDSGTSPD